MGNLAEEIESMCVTVIAGLDYDDCRFALGTVDAEFDEQAVVLFSEKLVSDRNVVFSVPAVRRWVKTYGRDRATDMVAFVTAHSMGRMKMINDDTGSITSGVLTSDDDTIAKSDAYARVLLGGVSKDFLKDILTDIAGGALKGAELSMWRRALLDTAIESRINRAAAKSYVWGEDTPNLETQLHTWAEMTVAVCNDAYIAR